MPIYDYACTNCGQVTEVIHGINDSGPKFCPSCGAEGTMKKALSAPAVVFKGSGWAKVDRRSSSSSSGTKASKSKPADGATSSDGGSASKADGGGSTEGKGAGPASGGSASGGASAGSSKAES